MSNETPSRMTPSASVFDLFCECGTMLRVFTRHLPRPPAQCPRCGAFADSELSPAIYFQGVESYDEEGPDVQVIITG